MITWRLAIALIMAVSLWTINPLPTAAQDLSGFFLLSYEPVTFDKSEINGSEVFHATIAGRATCAQDLPMSVSEASITSQVVAEHVTSGTTVTLNASYTVTIKPFPSKKEDTAEITQVVPLQFPAQAESGDYNVIGKIVEAKVKVGFLSPEVTPYLPQKQRMGLVKYTAPEMTPTPATMPTPPPASTPTPASPPAPAPTLTLTPVPTPAPTKYIIPWWVWLSVAIAGITTTANIIWFLRYRTTWQNKPNKDS